MPTQSKNQSVEERRNEIALKLKMIMQEMFGIYQVEPTDESNLREAFMLDSIDVIELRMAIETEFGIHLSGDEADQMKTFGDAIRIITTQPAQ